MELFPNFTLISLCLCSVLACATAPDHAQTAAPASAATTPVPASVPLLTPAANQEEDWSRIGHEGGRIEMAGQGRVFVVATSSGLHLLEGDGCDQVTDGRLVRLDQATEGCSRNRMFDPFSHQTCLVTCRALAPPSETPPAPRLGTVMAYAGRQGEYLVVKTFNGLRLFERQLGCGDDLPVGIDVRFESSPEGCVATTIRPPAGQGGGSCGLWCR